MPRHRQVPSLAAEAGGPISELNTTPLIDVMLVLLIMFIITIPITTHKVPLDLPGGIPPARSEPIVHRLNLDQSGRITLDGAALSERDLPARLAAISAEPTSELHLRAESETPYDRFDRVLAAVKRAGVTRLGLVDNERFANAAG
ncbi:MAG TPA: biopolymer transporter ExbD [Allosphingosinicella sp.]|jgi:biopolymer transport protein ExbD